MTDLTPDLRDALTALPTPPLSLDFDSRVLTALCAPPPWWDWRAWHWHLLWPTLRPVMLGAGGSLGVTLLALHWTLSAPVSAPAFPAMPRDLAAAPAHLPSLDALLARPDLSAGSFAAWAALPPPPAPVDRRPVPRRRAERLRPDALVV